MNDYSTGAESNGALLMRLLKTNLLEIICKERHDKKLVRLYGVGDYWHAFEESAYQLSRLFEIHEVTILTHQDFPFPVVMTSISDDELRIYGNNHIFYLKDSGYRELVGTDFLTGQYREWHRKQIMDNGIPSIILTIG